MFETNSAVIFKRGEIVHLKIKEGCSLEVEESNLIISYLYRFYQGKPIKVYTDASDYFSVSEESKKAFAAKDLNDLIFKNAVYTNSLGIKLVGNLFIRLFKPGFPVKIFTEETSALRWLDE